MTGDEPAGYVEFGDGGWAVLGPDGWLMEVGTRSDDWPPQGQLGAGSGHRSVVGGRYRGGQC
ncbi:hypothetical protein [Nocardia sp. CNY236]|uniref:hypothetical protein n=1 Tax=Nocardia sp. CNY236 TaxID=1169152 RepID=UPI00041CBE5F|nr:hypothetical protein [Nocardia sp. CNY236]